MRGRRYSFMHIHVLVCIECLWMPVCLPVCPSAKFSLWLFLLHLKFHKLSRVYELEHTETYRLGVWDMILYFIYQSETKWTNVENGETYFGLHGTHNIAGFNHSGESGFPNSQKRSPILKNHMVDLLKSYLVLNAGKLRNILQGKSTFVLSFIPVYFLCFQFFVSHWIFYILMGSKAQVEDPHQ